MASNDNKKRTKRRVVKNRVVEPLVPPPSSMFVKISPKGTTGSPKNSRTRQLLYSSSSTSGRAAELLNEIGRKNSNERPEMTESKEPDVCDSSTEEYDKCNLRMAGEGISCGMKCGFLLFEYPGSGAAAAPPSVAAIIEAAVKSIAAAVDRLIDQLNPSVIDVRIVGYSLGAAVAITVANIIAEAIIRQASARKDGIFSSPLLDVAGERSQDRPVAASPLIISLPSTVQFDLKRLVLVAPFTSVAEWMAAFLRVPSVVRSLTCNVIEGFVESCILWDNIKGLSQLCAAINSQRSSFHGFQLSVLHGCADSTVPFTMGLQVANEAHRLFYPETSFGKFRQPNLDEAEQQQSCSGLSPRSLVVHRSPRSTPSGHENLLSDQIVHRIRHSEASTPATSVEAIKTKTSTGQQQPAKMQQQARATASSSKPPVMRYVYSTESETQTPTWSRAAINGNVPVGTAHAASPPLRQNQESSSNGPSVRFFELDGDHQTVLMNQEQQLTIFECFFSDWMTCAFEENV